MAGKAHSLALSQNLLILPSKQFNALCLQKYSVSTNESTYPGNLSGSICTCFRACEGSRSHVAIVRNCSNLVPPALHITLQLIGIGIAGYPLGFQARRACRAGIADTQVLTQGQQLNRANLARLGRTYQN